MDIFADEFRDFISLLNKHKVEHLLVGGYAVNLYGYNRPTGDLDVWVNPTVDNIERLADCVNEYGYAAEALREFAPKVASQGLKMELNEPPLIIDVLGQISGVRFAEVYPAHHTYLLEGLEIHLIDRQALLLSKMSSSRPKDLDDVQRLHGVEAIVKGRKLEVYERPDQLPNAGPADPDPA